MLHPHQKINDPLTTSEARIDGVNVRFSASFCSPSLPLPLVSCSKRRSSANGKEKDISTHFSPRPSWRARFKPTHLGAFSRLKNKWLFSYFPSSWALARSHPARSKGKTRIGATQAKCQRPCYQSFAKAKT